MNNESINYGIPKIDEYTAQMILYRIDMYIHLRYPHLIDINNKNKDIISTLNENSNFFVIKSYSEEDIHKSIKYNIWSSTPRGNQTLNNAFIKCKEKNGSVYLFFSSNKSGRFAGVAKMKSEVNENKRFPLWTKDNLWTGIFEVEWLFIKDVPFYKFNDIKIMLKEGITDTVVLSRDHQEVPFNEGIQMMNIISNYNNTNSLLEHFEYYDIRQDSYEKANPQLFENMKHQKKEVQKDEKIIQEKVNEEEDDKK